MTLSLPDIPSTAPMDEFELRLELACALYARGRISAVAGSHLAGIDLVTFQGALADRDIPRSYSVSDLHSDLAAMDRILGV
jgi:predicted HTH domain antitoxin